MIAYLDPGTGSIVLQVVVGGFAGLAVFFKMFGRKLMFWQKSGTELTAGETDVTDAAETAEESEPATVPPAEANS